MFTTELIAGAVSLDLQTEIPVSLNLSIADIREPEKRNGSFSKTIKLKGTKANNKFFEQTYNVNVTTSTWNANIKTSCYILQEGSVVFEGYLRLLQINVMLVNGINDIEYEVSIFGDNNSLFVAVGDSKLEDLDLSVYDHVYSRYNIVLSWPTTAAQLGSGYFYPLIDYGFNNFATNSFPVETWRPAFWEKTYVDYIFSTANKTYTSSFFNTDFFKKQFIPHCGDKFTMSAVNLALREFLAGDTGAAGSQNHTLVIGSNNGWWLGQSSTVLTPNTLDVKFNDDTTNPFTDPSNLYDPTTGVITINSTGNYNLTANINCEIKLNYPAGTVAVVNSTHPYHYKLLKSIDGGVTYTIAISNINNSAVALSSSYATVNYTFSVPTTTFYAGEKYKFVMNALVNSTTGDLIFSSTTPATTPILVGTASTDCRLLSTSRLSLKLATNSYSPGQVISVNDAIPKDIKQRDFLTSIFKKYNLYVDIDKDNPNNYLIETRDTFYANGSTKNWSAKLAWDKPINIKPMSELDWKTLIYRYKADTDYYGGLYFNTYQEPYGSYKKVIVNDFVNKEVKNELIFSPTPVVDNPNNDLIIPKIFSYDGTVVKPTKHNIRTLSYNGKITDSGWDFTSPVSDAFGGTVIQLSYHPDSAMVGHTTFGSSPYAAALSPTDSVEFGVPNEVYYFLGSSYTTNNLFNRFYSRQINEITDRDAKIVIAYLYLEPKDISQFDFRDTIFLDMEDSGAYYYVNKIMDYNPLANELTKVEFVKIKTYDAYTPTTIATTLVETGLGNIGMSTNRFGVSPNVTTADGAANNLMVGTNISSRSSGGIFSGENINIDTATERISVVNCNDVTVFSGVSGFASMNCTGIIMGASGHDISLMGCSGLNISDFVYNYTGIGVTNKTITVADNNSVEIGQFVNGKVTSGRYTPTLTVIANIDTLTTYEAQYSRVGNVVTVSGKFDIDPTAPAVATTLDISLPIDSNFTASYQCGGTAFATSIAGQGAAIGASAATDKARCTYISGDISTQTMFYQFTYTIQ